MKFPQRFKDFADLLEKEELSHFEVEQLNEKLFGNKTKSEKQLQQKYKAYDEKTIKQILQYQKKHELNLSLIHRSGAFERADARAGRPCAQCGAGALPCAGMDVQRAGVRRMAARAYAVGGARHGQCGACLATVEPARRGPFDAFGMDTV